jgi:hypothetical protein
MFQLKSERLLSSQDVGCIIGSGLDFMNYPTVVLVQDIDHKIYESSFRCHSHLIAISALMFMAYSNAQFLYSSERVALIRAEPKQFLDSGLAPLRYTVPMPETAIIVVSFLVAL